GIYDRGKIFFLRGDSALRLTSLRLTILFAAILAGATAARCIAQEEAAPAQKPDQAEGRKPADPLSTPTFAGLRFRLVGPAMISGRVVALAVDPSDRSRYFVGAASGGVWKTTNSGTTWTPVFDSQSSYSIGTVVLDPKNSSVVWVGTGENNSQRSVSYGD